MAYTNTRETLGEQATLDGLVSRTLTELVEDGVTVLGPYVLNKFTSLTHVQLPNVTTVGERSVSSTGITQIGASDFPALTKINNFSFADNTNLETAEFNSITLIGQNAFSGCSKLKHLIIRTATKCQLDSIKSFAGTPIVSEVGSIYVPETLVATYKSDNLWKNFFITSVDNYPSTNFGTIADSWTQILAAEADGTYLTKYSIGDTKSFEVDGVTHLMQIVAFDADDLADNSGKAHITWIEKTAGLQAMMNTTSTNANGWANSNCRTQTVADIYTAIDSELKGAIKEVKKTYFDKTTGNTLSVNDSLWIPSYRELFGEVKYFNYDMEDSGVIYTAITDGTLGTIKKYNGSAESWWLRSALQNDSSRFIYVNSSGKAGNSSANGKCQLVLGFAT